ncbi:MAG: LysR family transcriptional regulator [Methylobacteriaceae bacterium]|nr:LysR family transcriptional regulator [Methylobacteriaceae bacterium]
MLTLRQIEIIRAIMITGTVNGAAEMLNVSAPGVSRAMKHAESVVGLRLFSRQHGRYAPTHAARDIFTQMQDVFRKIEDLQLAIGAVRRGSASVFSVAAVPSLSQFVLPSAIARLRRKYPDLRMTLDVLKIEEAVDYLLLKKGEMAALSYKIDHPALRFQALASCSLMALVPADHALAKKKAVTIAMLLDHPLIGFDPNEPYGRNLARPFLEAGAAFELSIQARYAHTAIGLVARKLGVAVIDSFSVAGGAPPGVVKILLDPPSRFMTYVATNIDAPPSNYGESLIEFLRLEAKAASGEAG